MITKENKTVDSARAFSKIDFSILISPASVDVHFLITRNIFQNFHLILFKILFHRILWHHYWASVWATAAWRDRSSHSCRSHSNILQWHHCSKPGFKTWKHFLWKNFINHKIEYNILLSSYNHIIIVKNPK